MTKLVMKLVFVLSLMVVRPALAFQIDPQSPLTSYEQLKAAYEAAGPASIDDFPSAAHADDLKCVWVSSENPDEVYFASQKIFVMERFHGPILGTQKKVIINSKTDESVWSLSTNKITANELIVTDGLYQGAYIQPHSFRKEKKDDGSLLFRNRVGDNEPNFGNCWMKKVDSDVDPRS